MKAAAASLLTALLITGAAWASNITPQQLTSLSARVSRLEKSNAQLAAYVNGCLKEYVAVSEFGTETAGFQFQNADGSTQLTTALDVEQPGTRPQYRLIAAPAKCKLEPGRLP